MFKVQECKKCGCTDFTTLVNSILWDENESHTYPYGLDFIGTVCLNCKTKYDKCFEVIEDVQTAEIQG